MAVRVLLVGAALASVAVLSSAVLGLHPGNRAGRALPTPRSAAPSAITGGGTLQPGVWRVASGSWVGYAFGETSVLGTSTLSGRTSGVKGQVTVATAPGGLSLSGSTFTADLTTLSSGDPLVDQQVQNALGTSRYASARFDQATPVLLPSSAALQAGVTVTVSGTIMVRGVTRAVAVPLRVVFANGHLSVVGSVPFRLSDFGIDRSALGGLVTLRDEASLDLSLVLAHP